MVSKLIREQVKERAGNRCEYCLSPQTLLTAILEIDHIIPRIEDGVEKLENLALSCSSCNRHKGRKTFSKDKSNDEITLLFDPRAHQWDDHFMWADDGANLEGKTPTGRATIAVLKMNRDIVIRTRLNWVAAGWHPPQD